MSRRPNKTAGGVRHVHYTNCDRHGRQQCDAEQAKRGCKACELEQREAELQAQEAATVAPPAPESGHQEEEADEAPEVVPFMHAEPTGEFFCPTHGSHTAPKGEPPHCPICRTEEEHGPIGEADDAIGAGDSETVAAFASLALSMGSVLAEHGLAVPASPARFALAVYRFLRTCEGSDDGQL